jgi:hypothetical protein
VSREIHRNRGERGYRFKQAEAKAHLLRPGAIMRTDDPPPAGKSVIDNEALKAAQTT